MRFLFSTFGSVRKLLMKTKIFLKGFVGVAFIASSTLIAQWKFNKASINGIVSSEIKKEMRSEAWDALQFLNTSRAFPLHDIPEDAYQNAFLDYKSNFAS